MCTAAARPFGSVGATITNGGAPSVSGASEVYGAEALAGVVNITLREPEGFSSSTTAPPSFEQFRSAKSGSFFRMMKKRGPDALNRK